MVISTADFIKKYKHVDFKKIARIESSPSVRERLLGIHNLFLGQNRIEAAAAVGRNPEWLRMWVLRYDEGGYEKLFDKKKSGHPKYLSEDQEQELVFEIMKLQDERSGGRITAKDIHAFIVEKYDVTYKLNSIYDLLERIGMSWISSRSKHPLADKERQERFKQTLKARVKKIAIKEGKKKQKKPLRKIK